MMADDWGHDFRPEEDGDDNVRRPEEQRRRYEEEEEQRESPHLNFDFDFLSLIPSPKDYYGILEVYRDATDEEIRSNYIRLALKWHPDKRKEGSATSRFQEINEAYQVLIDPEKRQEYDNTDGLLCANDRNMLDYIRRHMDLMFSCNGLGMKSWIW